MCHALALGGGHLAARSADTSKTDSNRKEGALYGFFARRIAVARASSSFGFLFKGSPP